MGFPGIEVPFVVEIVEVEWFPPPSWIRTGSRIYVPLLAALPSQLSALVRGWWGGLIIMLLTVSEQRAQCLLHQQLGSAWSCQAENAPVSGSSSGGLLNGVRSSCSHRLSAGQVQVEGTPQLKRLTSLLILPLVSCHAGYSRAEPKPPENGVLGTTQVLRACLVWTYIYLLALLMSL